MRRGKERETRSSLWYHIDVCEGFCCSCCGRFVAERFSRDDDLEDDAEEEVEDEDEDEDSDADVGRSLSESYELLLLLLFILLRLRIRDSGRKDLGSVKEGISIERERE